MNIASKNRLSLRKLFTALLAVGPLAVLPSPVWAVLPTTSSFTTTSGTVSLSPSGQTLNISFSDKAILTWGTNATTGLTNFDVQAGDTWNFASSGAILNKVSKGTASNSAAIINGNLLGTSARVFVVANGDIVIGNGAQLNTQSLVLSTVPELADAVFQSLGDLQYGGGAATGSITFGGAVSVGGHLSATAATIGTAGASITAAGDVVLNSLTSAAGLALPTSTVNGNLTVKTNNGAITQSGAITVGAVAGTQTTTLNAGTADITLTNALNNFDRVALTGNVVSLKDSDIITIGGSSVGSLSMRVGGQPSTTAIATDGALVTTGDVSLESTTSFASGITIGNNSSIGGVFSAATSGGSISVTATGNSTTGLLSIGNVSNTVTAKQNNGATHTASSSWSAVTASSTAGVADPITGVVGLSSNAITVSNPQGSPVYSSSGPALTVQSPIATPPTLTAANAPGTDTVPASLTPGLIAVAGDKGGFGYDPLNPPSVSVIGGGGTNATASAVVNANGQITGINIISGGSNYIGIPSLVINSARDLDLSAARQAKATAVTDATGRIIGAVVTDPGAGYSTAVAPTITVAGAVTTGAGVTINTTSNLVTVAQGLGSTAGISAAQAGIRSERSVNLRAPSIETGANVTVTGNAAQTATLNATAGNLLVNSTVSAGRLTLLASGGNITQNSTNGTLTSSNTTATSTFSAPGYDIVLNTPKGGNNSLATLGLVLTGANVSIQSDKTLTTSTVNVTNNLTLQSASNTNIVLGHGVGPEATHLSVAGVLTATAGGSGTITDNNDSNLSVSGGMVLTSTTGAIAIDGPSILGDFSSTVRSGAISAATSGAVTLAETTSLNLGNIGTSATPVASLTVISTQGSIVDSGNIYATSATFKVSGSSNIVLDNGFVPANVTVVPATPVVESKIGTITLEGGVDNSITNLNGPVTIAAINNASGTTTVSTAGGLGTNNSSITLGNIKTGNLSVNSVGGFIEVAGNVVLTGNLSLAAGGVVPSVNTFGDIYGPVVSINNTQGRLTGVALGTTGTAPNLSGMLTYAVAPTVTVTGGGVTGTTPTPAALVEANLNPFTGQITGFNVTNSVLSGSTIPYNNTAGVTTAATVTLTGATNTSVVQTTGALKVAGTTTINTAGTANLYRNNDFNNVVLANSTGSAVLNDVNSLTVSGVTAGSLSVSAGTNGVVATGVDTDDRKAEAGAWGVTLGNVSAASLSVTAANGGAGNSGRIVQNTGSSIWSYGTAAFTTTNNTITVANAGNSFGRVQVSSAGGAITLTEDGTIKLGSLSSSNGTVSLTSRSGNIIEDATGTAITTGATGNVSLTAANGSIMLGNATGLTTANFSGNSTVIGGRVNASAPSGSVALTATVGNLNLGTIDANTLRASAVGNLTQAAAAKVFGSTTLSAGGNIAITNNANNFGRVSATGAANISIVESGTLNLGTVTMPDVATGNFSATSVNGDIIDTGLSNVRPGGKVGSAGTGVVSLTAANGNITLDDPTTEFPTLAGVVFNAKNVTLAPLGLSPLVLGAANQTAMASNLTVTSALGSIGNAGAVKVTGDAAFQTSTGDISLVNAGNAFGTVRFAGRLVSITEADDVVLATGSSASEAAAFNALGGSISVVNRGGTINLSKTSFFTASGNITLPKLITAGGTITLAAPGTKDLSALSQSGDLNGIAPINIGVGTYVPPSQ